MKLRLLFPKSRARFLTEPREILLQAAWRNSVSREDSRFQTLSCVGSRDLRTWRKCSRAHPKQSRAKFSKSSHENEISRAKITETVRTCTDNKLKISINSAKEAKEIGFLGPTVGAKMYMHVYAASATSITRHGHYLQIYPGINMRLFIQERSGRATCRLLTRRIFAYLIVFSEPRLRQTRPLEWRVWK